MVSGGERGERIIYASGGGGKTSECILPADGRARAHWDKLRNFQGQLSERINFITMDKRLYGSGGVFDM